MDRRLPHEPAKNNTPSEILPVEISGQAISPNEANYSGNRHESLDAALNELDTAILGIVDTLDMPTSDVADYLDTCLGSSFWQRRLQREPAALRELQVHVIRGRANWLWSRTTLQNRKAFFAVGIGYKAGNAIEERLTDIAACVHEHLLALLPNRGKCPSGCPQHFV